MIQIKEFTLPLMTGTTYPVYMPQFSRIISVQYVFGSVVLHVFTNDTQPERKKLIRIFKTGEELPEHQNFCDRKTMDRPPKDGISNLYLATINTGAASYHVFQVIETRNGMVVNDEPQEIS